MLRQKALFSLAILTISTFAGAELPKVGESYRDFELANLSGEKVKLSTVQATGPVVLVFLRGYPGYQCPLCTKQVAELVSKAGEFQEAGAKVVLIYPGASAGLDGHAKEFATGKDMPANFIFLLDPDYTVVKDYDLRWDADGETAYPSSFVIDRAGKISYALISKGHGGRAKTGTLVAALKKG